MKKLLTSVFSKSKIRSVVNTNFYRREKMEQLDLNNRPFYNSGYFAVVNSAGEIVSPVTTANNYDLVVSWIDQCISPDEGAGFVGVWIADEEV